MSLHPLPSNPADITPQWLTEVLHRSGALPESGSVASITREPVGEGVGMMADIEFLTPSYEGDATGAPARVVGKFPTQNETNRGVAVHYNVYKREVLYFAELEQLNSAAGPKIHLSDIQGETDFVIIMEDLSAYRLGDQVTGATLAETETTIDELAKLHGSFWGKMDDSQYDWLPRFANSQNAANLAAGSEAGWDVTVDVFGEHIPKWMRDAKGAYLAGIPALQERLDSAPRTLVHGDCRMDNLFFGSSPEHHPMVLFDWQGPLRGRGMHDVAYMLGQSTQTEARRGGERDLIARYVDGLAAQGVDGYDFDHAWADYRTGILYIWVYATVIAGTLDATNERGNAWMAEMVKRNVAAIEDLGCLDLL